MQSEKLHYLPQVETWMASYDVSLYWAVNDNSLHNFVHFGIEVFKFDHLKENQNIIW